MPRRRADMITDTKDKLIAAARKSFGSVGYADTSMDELCAGAGLTRGALYHHFGGKAGLLEAVVRQIDLEIEVRMDRIYTTAPDKWVGLCAGCNEFLRTALEPEIQRILLRDAPAVLGQRLREIDEESSLVSFIEALEQLKQAGRIVECDAEATARFLNGALFDTALWIAGGSDQQQRLARAQQTLGYILRGLERRPPIYSSYRNRLAEDGGRAQ